MNLRLADPLAIKSKAAEITRIGSSVNDPGLLDRIEEACRKKQAFFFASKEVFVVLKPVVGPGVLVWVAHSGGHVDWLSYIFELEQFSRDINAKHLTFWSNRKGFFRKIPQFGFSSRSANWMGKSITVWTKQL